MSMIYISRISQGKGHTPSFLGQLLETLLTSHTSYYLHTDQLDIYYKTWTPILPADPQCNIL